jgi:hypothetical protein
VTSRRRSAARTGTAISEWVTELVAEPRSLIRGVGGQGGNRRDLRPLGGGVGAARTGICSVDLGSGS